MSLISRANEGKAFEFLLLEPGGWKCSLRIVSYSSIHSGHRATKLLPSLLSLHAFLQMLHIGCVITIQWSHC